MKEKINKIKGGEIPVRREPIGTGLYEFTIPSTSDYEGQVKGNSVWTIRTEEEFKLSETISSYDQATVDMQNKLKKNTPSVESGEYAKPQPKLKPLRAGVGYMPSNSFTTTTAFNRIYDSIGDVLGNKNYVDPKRNLADEKSFKFVDPTQLIRNDEMSMMDDIMNMDKFDVGIGIRHAANLSERDSLPEVEDEDIDIEEDCDIDEYEPERDHDGELPY